MIAQQIRNPTRLVPLYYASLLSVFLEYAAAIYFMFTLAQTPVQMFICLLIALVVSTYTIVMWTTIGDLISKGRVILALGICVILNAPAFIYDVHGFLGVTSEINRSLEANSDVAADEKRLINAQLKSVESISAMNLNPADLIAKNSELTAANNQLSREKAKCKNQWGSCAKAIDRQEMNNLQLIESNNSALSMTQSAIDSSQKAKASVESVISGENDNRKAHEVFKVISNWVYGNINHAKEVQGKVLGWSAVFLSALVMFLPFLANILCFDIHPAPLYQATPFANEEQRLWNGNEKTEQQPEPEPVKEKTWQEKYQDGEVSGWSAIFAKNQQPETTSAYSVNTPAVVTPVTTFASTNAVERTAPLHTAGVSLSKHSDNQMRGTSEFRPYKKIGKKEINTTSKLIVKGAGFAAPLVPNPDYVESDVVKQSPPVESIAIDPAQIDAPAPSKQSRSDSDAASQQTAAGRSKSSLKGLSELIDCVLTNDVLFHRGLISQTKVGEFMKCGRPKASEFIDALKAEKILDATGKKIIEVKK